MRKIREQAKILMTEIWYLMKNVLNNRFLNLKMARFTKENSKISVLGRDLEFRNGLTIPSTLEIGQMTKPMDKVNYIMPQVISMMESGKTIRLMAKELIYNIKAVLILEI